MFVDGNNKLFKGNNCANPSVFRFAYPFAADNFFNKHFIMCYTCYGPCANIIHHMVWRRVLYKFININMGGQDNK